MKLKFIFFLEHSFASLFMISPEASGLNHDDFIVFLFWRKIKKIVGMISVNIQISQKKSQSISKLGFWKLFKFRL